ncbi:phosphatase PAP2 family protein [Leifsonia sp. SIMBA_070]|uniref:phosphatase PAP2 family protein n=1 Tax=Leifsonia sp. SIMBA_070 TaxID=3085810 RepID=UPI00397DE04C
MTGSPLNPDPKETGVRGELTDDRFVGDRDLTHWYTPVGRELARFAHWISVRLGPNAALIITLVVGMTLAVILTLVAAQVYDAVTDKDGVAGLDLPILNAAIHLRSPVLNAFTIGYTDIAGEIGMPLIAVTAILILTLRRRSWTPVLLIGAAGLGSLAMTIAGKDLIGRHRPPLTDAVPPYEYSPSFPSGHTLNAVVVIGIIAYLLILRRHSVHARVLLICGAAVYAFTVRKPSTFQPIQDQYPGAVTRGNGTATEAMSRSTARYGLRRRVGTPRTGGRTTPSVAVCSRRPVEGEREHGRRSRRDSCCRIPGSPCRPLLCSP